MDEELKTYLTGMETRLTGRMDAIEGHQEAMEARPMSRINDSQERLLERMAATDKRLANLEYTVASQTEMARSTNTLLATIAASLTDIAGRVTRLDNKT